MAMVDYRWCSGCGRKCFYDAELNYNDWEMLQSDNRQELPWGCADMRAICNQCYEAGFRVELVRPPTEWESGQ